ncbi:MAG: hypothetical protein JOS17DRAFT_776991 [Linnemannia elongata]|nr:MAG: hypothetical protein JOS17DRAFT_776991 [Linnemannia elongata]
MESLPGNFPGAPSAVSISTAEHHRWIYMFPAQRTFGFAITDGQDKIRVVSIPIENGGFRLRIRGGNLIPSTELRFTDRTNLEIKGGHRKALKVMAFTIPCSSLSGENDLRVELTIEKPDLPFSLTAAQGQGQGVEEEPHTSDSSCSLDSSSSSESPKSTDSDDSNAMMSP